MNEKLKYYFHWGLVHLLFFVLGSMLFVFFFSTPLFMLTVFFYRGIVLLVLATLLTSCVFIYFKRTKAGKMFLFRDIALSASLVFCLNLVIFTHLPVTAERSVTIYVLSVMNKYENMSFTEEQMSEVLFNGYIVGHSEVEKRFDEQLVSGNIIKVGEGYKISPQGKKLMNFYKVMAKLFNISAENLNP